MAGEAAAKAAKDSLLWDKAVARRVADEAMRMEVEACDLDLLFDCTEFSQLAPRLK